MGIFRVTGAFIAVMIDINVIDSSWGLRVLIEAQVCTSMCSPQ